MQVKSLKAIAKYLMILVLGLGCYPSLSLSQTYSFSFPENVLDSLEKLNGTEQYAVIYRRHITNFIEENEDQKEERYSALIDYCKRQNLIKSAKQFSYNFAYYLYREISDSLAINQFNENIDYLKSFEPIDSSLVLFNLYYLGRAEHSDGAYNNAIISLKEALAWSRLVKNSTVEINSLKWIGICYDNLEETSLSLAYLEAMAIKSRIFHANKARSLATNLSSYIQRIPFNAEYAELGMSISLEAISAFEKMEAPERINNYLAAFTSLAGFQIENGDYDPAIVNLNAALKIHKTRGDNRYLDAIYEYLGAAYKNLSKLDSALFYYEKVHQLRIEEKDSLYLNYSHHNLGEIYDSLDQFSAAAEQYQFALKYAVQGFEESDFDTNPSLEKGVLNTDYLDLIKDLNNKGGLFFRWYLKENNPEYLKIAFLTYQRAIEFTYERRTELLGETSKMIWQNDLFPIFEEGLLVLEEAHAKGLGIGDYTGIAFDWMEKSKAVVLLESLLRQKLAAQSVGQDSLFNKVDELKSELSFIRSDIAKSGETPQNRLTELIKQIELWETELEIKRSKEKYDLSSVENNIIKLDDLKKKILSKDQLFLEYFYGEQSLFLLIASQERQSFFRISNAGFLSKQIQKLRGQLVQQAPTNDLQASSLEISQTIKLNELSQFVSKSELLIIPDGLLAILPFEILSIAANQNSGNYLINDYSISYAFSATTLQLQNSRQVNKKLALFTGMAPSFNPSNDFTDTRNCTADQLVPLLENVNEVKRIHDLLGGHIVEGQGADKTYFLDQALQSRIIHLATHACLDDEDPTKSKIFFTDDPLYAHELDALQLTSEMLVLSACETGVGEYQRGEGVMSLARNFAQAGVPSLTLSYWSVSDQSTSELMQYYYQALKTGLPKHEALRQAKLNYLNNQETVERLHPFYWAAFVHFGDYRVIDMSSSKLNVWSLFGLIVIVGLLLFFRARRSRRSN